MDPQDAAFRELLTANGTLHDNPRNGDSFYVSLAAFLQDGKDIAAIKEVLSKYMRANVDAFNLEGRSRGIRLARVAQLFKKGVEPSELIINLTSRLFDLRFVIFHPPNGRTVVNRSENFRDTVYLSSHHNATHFNRLTDIADLPRDAGDLEDGALEDFLNPPPAQEPIHENVPEPDRMEEDDDPPLLRELANAPHDPAETNARFVRMISHYCTVIENEPNCNSFYIAMADFMEDGTTHQEIKNRVHGRMRADLLRTLQGSNQEEQLASLAAQFNDDQPPLPVHMHLAADIFDLRIIIFYAPNGRTVYSGEAYGETMYLAQMDSTHFNRLIDAPELPHDIPDLLDGAFHTDGIEEIQNPLETPPEPMQISQDAQIAPIADETPHPPERQPEPMQTSQDCQIDPIADDIQHPPEPQPEHMDLNNVEHLNPREIEERFRKILYHYCQVWQNNQDANSFYRSLADHLDQTNPGRIRQQVVNFIKDNLDQFDGLFDAHESETDKNATVDTISAEGVDAMEIHLLAATMMFNLRIVVYFAPNTREIVKKDGYASTLYLARNDDYHFDRIVACPELPSDAEDLEDGAFDVNGLEHILNPPVENVDVDQEVINAEPEDAFDEEIAMAYQNYDSDEEGNNVVNSPESIQDFGEEDLEDEAISDEENDDELQEIESNNDPEKSEEDADPQESESDEERQGDDDNTVLPPMLEYLLTTATRHGRAKINIYILLHRSSNSQEFPRHLADAFETVNPPLFYILVDDGGKLGRELLQDVDMRNCYVVYRQTQVIPFDEVLERRLLWMSQVLVIPLLLAALKINCDGRRIKTLCKAKSSCLCRTILDRHWSIVGENIKDTIRNIISDDIAILCDNCNDACRGSQYAFHWDIRKFTLVEYQAGNNFGFLERRNLFHTTDPPKKGIMADIRKFFLRREDPSVENLLRILDSNAEKKKKDEHYSYLLLVIDGPSMMDHADDSPQRLLNNRDLYKLLYAGSTCNAEYRHSHMIDRTSSVNKFLTKHSAIFLLRSVMHRQKLDALKDEAFQIELIKLWLQKWRDTRHDPTPFLLINTRSEPTKQQGFSLLTAEQLVTFCNELFPIIRFDPEDQRQFPEGQYRGNYKVEQRIIPDNANFMDREFEDVQTLYEGLEDAVKT